MATVEEVGAALDRAAELTATVIDKLFSTESEAGDALQLIEWVRQSSVDPMGAPELRDAIEKIGEANAQLRAALEANRTYRGTL